MAKKPNVVYVFSDQHRAQATGYGGDTNVLTPNLDRLKNESLSLSTAVAGIPVCGPSRACLMTGQNPLTHGVFLNDVSLGDEAVSIAQAFSKSGYDTGYIGKWHLDGHGRSAFIPKERRQGFDFWRVLECTHEYNDSYYYKDRPTKLRWEGYDAETQTREAQRYIRGRDQDKPFFLMLSWGPPHNPYQTAPQKYKDLYDPSSVKLRPNVPKEDQERARRDLAGYYAHITALDTYIGELLGTLKSEGIDQDTVFIYTSDHGDMLGSQGHQRKQYPWDESIRIPFLLRYPRIFGEQEVEEDIPFGTVDIMPTLLGLCGIAIPDTVEGVDYTPYIKKDKERDVEAVLIQCIHPFGEGHRGVGGREYRGVRTRRYTYVEDLNGPWLLYDNIKDPSQMDNLCNNQKYKEIQDHLHGILMEMLQERGDQFLPSEKYIARWGYTITDKGIVPYEK